MRHPNTTESSDLGGNRYQVLDSWSDGSIVSSHRAIDRDTGQEVIVRDLPKRLFRETGVARYMNEVKLTSALRCETYQRPLNVELSQDHLRVVYAYVAGPTLAAELQNRSFDARQTMLIARDLLLALDGIHQTGCLQRDIRPSNILVGDEGQAVLCGYIPLCDPDAFASNDPLGREFASFMSPELSGVIDHNIGEVSDLYSLGHVLNTCLTGVAAFEGDVNDILYQHMTSDPDPARFPTATPDLVIKFIDKLICKEPRERYQTALAALFDVDKILTFIDEGDISPKFVIGTADRRTVLIEPAFVGREMQALKLRAGIEEAEAGRFAKILMSSESGMGKTRILSEITSVATRKDLLILNGRASQHATLQPYAPWLQMLDQLAKRLVTDEPLRTLTAQRMEDFREEVITAMPAIANIFHWTGARLSGPDKLGQGRILLAFRTLFAGLGRCNRSVMLTIDDCQWIDDQSMRLLTELCETEAHNLLLLTVTRPGERDQQLQQMLPTAARITLGPLSNHGVKQLALSMAGPLPSVAIDVVQKYAEGSPFMAAAVLRGMVESNVLVVEDEAWKIDHPRLSSFQAADNSSEILVARLTRLPDRARTLLTAAAVIGKDFSLDAAASLAGMEMADAHQAFKPARAQRLVWSRPNSMFSFVHDTIRDAVLSGISKETLSEMHGQLGRYLETHFPEQVFEIAFHFDAAEMHLEALPYALSAAQFALNSFSLASAQMQLSIAVRALQHADIATRHQVESMMSEVLILQGKYDETEIWLQRAAETAVAKEDHARIAMKRGELSFKRGNKDQAVEYFEASLRQLGQPVCANRLQLARNLTIEVLRQARNSLFPTFCGRKQVVPSESQTMAFSLYSQIAHAYWFTRDKYYTLWAHLRGMNAAERYPANLSLAQSYSEHAPVMTLLRWESRGVDYAMRSLKIRKSLDNLWGQGQSRNFLSILLYSFSRFDDCIEQASQAVEILERTGDYWEMHIARYQLAASLLRIGKCEESVRQSKINYQSAVQHGDFQGTGNIIDVWARAALGDIPQEVLDTELNRDVFDLQRTCQVRLAYGVREYYRSNFIEAVSHFQQAVEISENAPLCNAYISPCYTWLCTAMRKQLQTQPLISMVSHKRQLQTLLRNAKKSLALSRRFTNELPHALRELAAAYALAGRDRIAQNYFQRSVTASLGQSATLEHANTIVLHHEFAIQRGWAIDDAEYACAVDLLSRLQSSPEKVEQSNSLSLFDRFDSLLASGRKIATSVLPAEIYHELSTAAKKILRGEQVFVIAKSDSGAQYVTFPEAQIFDRALLNEAKVTRSTVVKDEETCSDHGVTTRHKGTFLCSPIDVQGQPAAFLYITNKRFSGLFGSDEIRIADYLASFAGAALERADSFQQLQELNQNLEEKVQDRMAAVVQRSKELESTTEQLQKTQEKLQHAKELAEEANHTKSDFLARMSHEIRTPITGILGFTELLLRGDARQQDNRIAHLETIHSNGTHLLQLLDDILDISKIEADKIEVESVACVPTQLINDILRSLHSKAIQKDIELNLQIDSPIPETIISDPTRLRQIVTNLVGNAVKFTDTGGVTVHLNSKGDLPTQGELEIIVEDTGSGMTPEQMARIFEPFVQADTSTTRKHGGTGLGLSIGKRLAEALGGTLSISSTVDVGTKFVFTFPVECLPETQILNPAAALAFASQNRNKEFQKIDVSGSRVLVVDDCETNRKLISFLLQGAGGEVVLATNGQEAVQLLIEQQLSVDIVLMDMQMPVMDGYTASQRLRQHGYNQPIVALTANAMVGDEAKCRQVGCTHYLTKPIDLDSLLQMVREAMLQSRAEVEITPREAVIDCQVTDLQEPASTSMQAESESQATTPLPENLLPNDWRNDFAKFFIESVAVALPNLWTACDSQDFIEATRQAHWIKGSGKSVGLPHLSQLAAGCEMASREQDGDRLHKSLREMQNFVDQAQIVQARYALTNQAALETQANAAPQRRFPWSYLKRSRSGC